MLYKKNGFTLLETLVGVSIVGVASVGLISNNIDESNKEKTINFFKEAKSVVEAVDHRITIDGYDPSLWNKTQWNNTTEIKDNLIKQSLTSLNSTSCSGGNWNPALNTENNATLIRCNLWEESIEFKKYNMDAQFDFDGLGFIQDFNFNIYFKSDAFFDNNIKNIKSAMNKINIDNEKEMAGSHYFDFISKNTNEIVSFNECNLLKSNCFIKMSFERSGGGEYISTSGTTSILGEKLTFVETKGEAPMKCIRWKNTAANGTGTWTPTNDEDCGVGIYKELGHPAVVDVAAETGTFEHVLLNQECNLYEIDSVTGLAKVSGQSPCGMLNGTESIQVVDNSQANTLLAENGDFQTIKVNHLIAKQVSTNTLTVNNLFKAKDVEINGNLAVSNNITGVHNVTGSGTFTAPVGEFDNIDLELTRITQQINSVNDSISKLTSPWHVGGWGSCNTTCGNGYRYRSVSCPANAICTGSKPSTRTSCSASSGCWSFPGNKGDNSGNDGPNR